MAFLDAPQLLLARSVAAKWRTYLKLYANQPLPATHRRVQSVGPGGRLRRWKGRCMRLCERRSAAGDGSRKPSGLNRPCLRTGW